MSTYVLMKIFESSPTRYDLGIHLLTLGEVDKAYDRLAAHIKRGQMVLDIGCGTGALTIRAAQKGADVKAIDINSQMIDIAQQRIRKARLFHKVTFCEMGVAELNTEYSESYDVVMSGLCFSELSENELTYTLKEIKRILKPGGLLLIGDEVRPENICKRMVFSLVRIPLTIITYLITQTTTHAIVNLPEKARQAGFIIKSIRLNGMENFIELVAQKPNGAKR